MSAQFMGAKVYDTMIPRNVRISEAPSYGKPVLVYDLKCVGSEAYLQARDRSDPARARPADRSLSKSWWAKHARAHQRIATIDGGHGAKRAFAQPATEFQFEYGVAAMSSKELAMADEARSRLGRGLASLIGDVGGERRACRAASRNQRKVPIEFLKPNPRNPRRAFSDAELSELASSIKRAWRDPADRGAAGARARRTAYEIIAGERRWRAAQLAGLHEVPIVPARCHATPARWKS